MELKCWCSNVGTQNLMLVFNCWYSAVGSQMLVFICWYSNVGFQILVFTCWYSNVGAQMLVLKCWYSTVGILLPSFIPIQSLLQACFQMPPPVRLLQARFKNYRTHRESKTRLGFVCTGPIVCYRRASKCLHLSDCCKLDSKTMFGSY